MQINWILRKGRQLSLVEFSSQILNALLRKKKIENWPIGHPFKRKLWEGSLQKRGRKQPFPTPQAETRYDEVGHWPKREENKNKCRFFGNTIQFSCMKRKTYLCLAVDRSYFYEFHTCKKWNEFFLILACKKFLKEFSLRNEIVIYLETSKDNYSYIVICVCKAFYEELYWN